jgi:hypothetical protein
VSLKDIDVTKIIAYTAWPLLLQAKVTKSACSGMTMGALVWSCKDVSYQFWQNVFNNNTVGMERSNLQNLPKSRDITMTVTQYYVRDSIEYVAILNFVLFVNTADLVPVVSYPTTFNTREAAFMIVDGNSSYDPTAVSAGTTDIPVKCSWECPAAFSESCNA